MSHACTSRGIDMGSGMWGSRWNNETKTNRFVGMEMSTDISLIGLICVLMERLVSYFVDHISLCVNITNSKYNWDV